MPTQAMIDASDKWIADGSATAAPVTDSTPALVDTPAVPDTPAPVSTEPAVLAAPLPVADPNAPVAGEPLVPASPAKVDLTAEFIEGQITKADGTVETYKIPKGVQLPWKRGEQSGFAPVENVIREHMMQRDYQAKTREVADQRRQVELREKVALARAGELENWNKELAELAQKSLTSQEDNDRYQQFISQYQANPMFRKMVDDARDGRVAAAGNTELEKAQYDQAVSDETYNVLRTIEVLAARYPQVDPETVRVQYARDLRSDAPPELSPVAIESYFKQQAVTAERYTAPLKKELDEMRATLASLQAQGAANSHNATVKKAIERTLTPVAVPAGGSPAAPVVPKPKGSTLDELTNSWIEMGQVQR